MAQNAQNCLIQREMQKQPKNFKKCQIPEGVQILGQMAFGVGITSIHNICKEYYVNFYPSQLVEYNFQKKLTQANGQGC